MSLRGTVVLTDHPWPDVEVEREIIAAAGYQLIAGPVTAGSATDVERLVAQHDPLAIMTCWAQVSAAAIASPHDLRIVARLGVGLDNIHLSSASARGAWVTNVPDYCVEEVSDHAVALLLAHARGIARFDRQTQQGQWRPESATGLRRIRELCVGIIGYGHTGVLTARKLSQGFGCRVLVNSPSLLAQHVEGAVLSPGIAVASLPVMQQQADVLILHVPLLATTQHLINAEFLRACVRRPLLINVSRGGVVDSHALLQALQAGCISAAALDVIEGEPAPPLELLHHAQIIATPHVAYSSDASLLELRQRGSEEVVRVLRGETPLHACNQPVRV